ncbi:platelet-activating factor acetylhydrolase IB subunit alpha1-like [Uloborus diversus]|uniref:platelet-activating factor acetylhydrolase IB subunit alpha1-like n=1 Tax=Uloborus diversus TaxID=327109 RepID=UPI0024098753|nr:platelet-activating factor acetylhydrolase IB subunit alpha1-like [Uloborus diversus]XP_054712739.1 platelet-activating factor acetylhydrolase IB subunit alpha1-like [Uloborus diversus]
MNPAVQATPPEDKRGDDRWMCMHKHFLVAGREQEPDVLFIGDFVVSMAAHTEMWEKLFVPLHCLNLGISEDETHNVLWRIENGELDATDPKVIVLSVGSNNISHTAEQIVAGIQSCAQAILDKKPNATLIVLKLLPCGQNPNPVRIKMEEVNKKLKHACQGLSNTQLIDIDPGFVLPDGTISHHDMYDYLHLTRSAYSKSFEILYDLLQQILTDNPEDLPETE